MTDRFRKQELGAIHTARRDLALSDDSYRDLLERLTGKRSAADLDVAGRRVVIEEFRRLGWKKKSTPKRAGTRALAIDAQSRKIRALWLSLWQLGSVRDSSENALAAFVKRMVGRDALHWLSPAEANKVIETLKSWCIREGFLVDEIVNDDWEQVLLVAVWLKRVRLDDPAAQLDQAHFDNWICARTHSTVPGFKHLKFDDARALVEQAGQWLRNRMRDKARDAAARAKREAS